MLPPLDLETAQAIIENENIHYYNPRAWWCAWEFVNKDLPEAEQFTKRLEAMLNSPHFWEQAMAALMIKAILKQTTKPRTEN